MIEEPPDPKEIAHYHFTQLRTIKLAKGNEEAPKNSLNVIASASKYGLIFVGISNGFKVLKLENVLDLDEDKGNKNLEENYFCQIVQCETPLLLALSADQKTLAVCIQKNAVFVADMYDIAAFADPEGTPQPFHSVQLSGGGCKLKEFVWNPASEGMYAYCLSDGSLHTHELAGLSHTVVASVPNAGATAASWSPKGKQLAVGKGDGSFSQYKPTLQEVKNIPPPGLGEALAVANICWLSTTQFAVLYVLYGKSASPYLFLVSTPKGSPAIYTNYYDICLGNSTNVDQRYFLHHESAWGILICASTDSIEVAVLGDSPNWVQWEVKDDGRILLPAKNGAKHAIAVGAMYCSQRRIIISESESYPPMPIIFYLTDNGLLLSYHMINSAPNCVNLIRPSTPINRDGERKRPGMNQIPQQPVPVHAVTASPTVPLNAASNANVPLSSFHPASVEISNSTPVHFSSTFGFTQKSPFQAQTDVAGRLPTSPFQHAPPTNTGLQFGNSPILTKPQESENVHKMIRTDREKRPLDFPSPNVTTAVPQSTPHIDSNINKVEEKEKQDTYMSAVIEEVQTFEKELQDLKKSGEQLCSIGTQDEMSKLKTFTLSFEEFHSEMAETMKSLNSEIHSLKNTLLESFVMIEEANSRERRKNDHSYLSMLQERTLDPMTAKRMQIIDQHYLYLSTQLQEVSNKLDQDWVEYLEKKKETRKAIHNLSSTEAIYKTVVNNQNIIHNLRRSIDYVSKKSAERKLEIISRRKNQKQFVKRSGPEELSQLADAFLEAKISQKDEEKPQLHKKISTKSQNILKNFLVSSPVASVRPTSLYSPAQSRLISRSFLYKDKHDADAKDVINSQNIITHKDAVVNRNVTNIKSSFTSSPPTIISMDKMHATSMPVSQGTLSHVGNINQQSSSSFLSDVTEKSKTFSSKLSEPSLPFAPTQVTSTPISASAPPIYEDISPPDSPTTAKSGTGADILLEPTSQFSQGFQGSLSKAFPVKNNLPVAPTETSQPPSSAIESKPLSFSSSTFPAASTTSASSTIGASFAASKPLGTSNAEVSRADSSSEQSNKPLSSAPFPFFKSNTSFSNFAAATAKDGIAQSTSAHVPNSFFDFSKPSSEVSSTPVDTSPPSFSFPLKETGESSNPSLTFATKEVSDNSKSSFFSATADSLKPSLTFATEVQPDNSKPGLTFAAKESPDGLKPKSLFSFPPKEECSLKPTLTFEIRELSPSDESHDVVQNPESTSLASSNVFGAAAAPNAAAPKSSFFGSAQKSSFFGGTAFTVSKESSATIPSASQSSNPLPGDRGSAVLKSISNMKNLFLQGLAPLAGEEEAATAASSDKSGASPVVVSSGSLFNQNVARITQQPSSPGEPTPASAAETTPAAEALSTQKSSEVTKLPTMTSLFGAHASLSASLPSKDPQSAIGTDAKDPSLSASPEVASDEPTQTSPVVESSTTPAVTTSSLVFGTPASSQPLSFFGQTGSSLFSPASMVATSADSAVSPVSTSGASAFSQATTSAPSFFSQTGSTQSSFFVKPATEAPLFSQTSGQASPFTATAAGSVTPSKSSFFSPATTEPAPVFGNAASPSSGFGSSQSASSGFSFGQSAFGQAQGSFGLAKAVYGQSTPAFGATPSPPTSASTFSQSPTNNVFGQGSFFSGLGGQASAENASKNVFAMGNTVKPTSETNVFGASTFGSSGASAFGAKPAGSFTGGAFSSNSGSVAQSGFAAFQQTPQKTGGFGAAPSFGGAPSFGSPPAFGGAPSFGSGSPLGSMFGSQQATQTANFSSFAQSSSPTFGSLASQSGGGFGSPQQPTFGQSNAFGGGGFGGSSFGQNSSFGSASPPSSGSSAFTQWRN